MSLLAFPDELLLDVSSYIFLPDLSHFALTNIRLFSLLQKRLSEDWQLHQQWKCTAYLPHSDHQPRWKELRERGLCAILLDLLRNPAAAQYVRRLEVDTVEDDAPALNLTEEERDMLRTALQRGRWLPRPLDEMYEKIFRGDDDYVLALILELVPNLTEVLLPAHCWGGVNLDPALDMVASVARKSIQPSPRLPLHRLHHIDGCTFNGFYGIGLKGLVCFLALPSVRSVAATCVAEDEFEWPRDLPNSRVSIIRFRQSTVTSKAIRGFAEGLIGPCWISHEWGWRRHDRMPDSHGDWTDLRIPFEGAKEDDWMIGDRTEESSSEWDDEDVQGFEYDEQTTTWTRKHSAPRSNDNASLQSG